MISLAAIDDDMPGRSRRTAARSGEPAQLGTTSATEASQTTIVLFPEADTRLTRSSGVDRASPVPVALSGNLDNTLSTTQQADYWHQAATEAPGKQEAHRPAPRTVSPRAPATGGFGQMSGGGSGASTATQPIHATIPAGGAGHAAGSAAGSAGASTGTQAASMLGAYLSNAPSSSAGSSTTQSGSGQQQASSSATTQPAPTPLAAASPTTSSGSVPPPSSPSLQGLISSTYFGGNGASGGSDPLYVLDVNNDVVLPSNSTPINTFSTYSMNLQAQVSGATVTSYSWNFSQAPDATSITGSTTYNAQFSWASFQGSAHTDTISVTEYPSGGSPLTQSYTFTVAPTTSPGFASTAPTSAATWPSVVTPDELLSQPAVSAGPYAGLGLADGAVQTSHSLPSYNPNVAPLGLVYSGAVANPQPVFLIHYQLSPSQSLPSSVTAQLTLTNSASQTVYSGPTMYYNPSSLNPGDWMQLALQANATGLATGRYNWQIQVTAGGSPTTYSGAVNIITSSTTPTSLTNNPFGPGWSLDNVERLYSVNGGVILQNPDGTSLWFANGSQSGTFVTPAGDFSTLAQNTNTGVYTRTLTDGTQILFNSSGQQTSIVDRNGNTTSFSYNGNGQLTSVTDMNSQVNTLTYNGSGRVTAITDPASRSLTLGYNGSNQLTSITDPNHAVWTYGYDSSNDLTQLSDPRSNLTPPNPTYTTTFTYSSGRVSQVTQPDGTAEALVPVQLQGLGGTSSNPATAVLMVAASANYTDPNSQVWGTYLDSLGFGQTTEAIDPLGDTSLTYRDSNGLGWLSADPLGRRDRYFFDTKGDTTEDVHADDSLSGAYSFNNFGQPMGYHDEMGHQWTYTYDNKGNLTQVENPLLATETFAYNAAGLVTSMTDWMGNTWTSSYDSLNRMTGETSPLKYTQAWGYDSAGDITSYTNQNNVTDTYTYNNMGWLTQTTLPLNATTSAIYTYGYDLAGNLTSVTVPLYYNGSTLVSATTTAGFDSLNRLTSVTDPLNDQTKYSYDSAGNLIGVTNALGYQTTYSYNAADELTGVTIPISGSGQQQVSATTTYTLDRAGETTVETNPLNQMTQYSYSVRGWLSSVTDPIGNVTSYGYNASGDQTSVKTTPANNGTPVSSTFSFDALHRMTQASYPVAPATNYAYDKDSHLTSITGWNNGQGNVTYGYDADGRQTSDSDALNNTYSYTLDGAGNVTKITNPLTYVTSYSYNEQNWLLSETDALNGVTSYGYNLAGWQTSEADPDNNLTNYSYNNAGWLTATTNPLNYQATYSYDNAGELAAMRDYNGRQTQYTYNEAGWQTGETWVNGNYQATYTYNNAGELTVAQDNNSSYSYSYDADGRVTKEVVTYPGLSSNPLVTLAMGFDGYGNRTSLTDSLGGSYSYSFNNNHQLTNLSLSVSGSAGPRLTFSYDTQDRLSQISRTVGTGMGSNSYDTINSSYGYDSDNRLTGLTYTNATTSTTLSSFTYAYDAASQVTGYTGPEGSLTYAYDKTGQLTGVSGARNESYTFDTNGNRTMSGYSTGAGNELLNDGSYTYTYDHNGNLLTRTDSSGNVWNYTWDYHNHLTEVTETNSSKQVVLDEKLTYDINDQLIGVNVNGAQQRWTVFDGNNPLIDFNGTGTLTERYVANPQVMDELYACLAANGTTSWYLSDRLGSVRQIVDPSGNVLDQLTYGAFGNILSETNASNGGRFKFDGGEWDGNLGLYRFGERWYNPTDGRWISQDPLGLEPDTNWYRYVRNAPNDFADPLGLYTSPIVSKAEPSPKPPQAQNPPRAKENILPPKERQEELLDVMKSRAVEEVPEHPKLTGDFLPAAGGGFRGVGVGIMMPAKLTSDEAIRFGAGLGAEASFSHWKSNLYQQVTPKIELRLDLGRYHWNMEVMPAEHWKGTSLQSGIGFSY